MNQTEEPLSGYLQSISKYPLLSAAQEISLARAIQAMLNPPVGLSKKQLEEIKRQGRVAKEKMICSNLKLVVAVANKYQNRGLEILDLIQEGNKGLLKAIEKFDPSQGYKFSTYAYWLIRQDITRALAYQSRLIRLPGHVLHHLNQIQKAQEKLRQQCSRKPQFQEIAEEVGISLKKLHKLMNARHLANISCLDQLVAEDTTLGELLPAPLSEQLDVIFRQEVVNQLNYFLAQLTDSERQVLALRYGLVDGCCKSVKVVGQQMGISSHKVKKLENSATSKLRQQSCLKELLEA